MKIRKTTASDFENIKNLMLEALQSDPHAFTVSYNEYVQNSDYWWHMYVDPYLRGMTATMFFAEEGDQILGMIGILYSTKERSKHVSTIVWFYVKPEFRAKQIGKALLEESLKEIPKRVGIKKINLTVTSNQQKAIGMYKKNGFEESGRQKQELQINGVFYDFIMMEKMIG